MRKMTRVVAGAVTAALLLPLAACGGSGSDSGSSDSKELNLLVPVYSDATKGLWQGIIKDFEKEHSDIKVNLEVQSWEDINTVITTKIQNKQAPDILNIDSFTSFADDELLYPAKDVVSKETMDKFPENFKKNATMDGTQYGYMEIGRASCRERV